MATALQQWKKTKNFQRHKHLTRNTLYFSCKVYVRVSACVSVCVCMCVCALRMVQPDKILCYTDTFIIVTPRLLSQWPNIIKFTD